MKEGCTEGFTAALPAVRETATSGMTSCASDRVFALQTVFQVVVHV